MGSIIANDLVRQGHPLVVIEDEVDMARQAKADGFNALQGNALDPQVLEAAGIGKAHTLLIAIPEGFEAGAIFERVRALNASVRVIARAHSDAEVAHLERLGVRDVVMGEREIASRMLCLTAEEPKAGTG